MCDVEVCSEIDLTTRFTIVTSASRYDPLRPDFIEVAGGFPALTGGAGGGGCWTFVMSGTA